MRVGWLQDTAGYVGGAELTADEFRDAAPPDIEIIDCPPGDVDPLLDRYVIQNCVTYTVADLAVLEGLPVVKYHHDVGPWLQPGVRAWLDEHAVSVCCSPAQAAYMGLDDPVLIPPPVDLERFERAAANVNGSRAGVVSVGQWRNFGKAAHRVAEWGDAHGQPVEFFGNGPFAPPGCVEVAYDDMPDLLARYQTFVFLPTVLEPFGRTVAEAWAAGCEVVANRLVGALHWIETDPDAISRAAQDFWKVTLT